MNLIRAMIAEDEQMAREELTYLLQKESDVRNGPSAETGGQLLDLFIKYEPDVIFLDVQMPGISGVDAAKQIVEHAPNYPPLFVFTTAYDQYAMDAFEVEAIDYLLKPYDDARFLKTMERVRKHLRKSDTLMGNPSPSNHQATKPKILIDDGERMVVLSPDVIYYAVTANRILEIHTKDEVIESRMTLQGLEEKLQGLSFFRTHRSYLVNLDFVRDITPWFNGTYNITLKDRGHTTLPVSRSARKVLLDMFNG